MEKDDDLTTYARVVKDYTDASIRLLLTNSNQKPEARAILAAEAGRRGIPVPPLSQAGQEPT